MLFAVEAIIEFIISGNRILEYYVLWNSRKIDVEALQTKAAELIEILIF